MKCILSLVALLATYATAWAEPLCPNGFIAWNEWREETISQIRSEKEFEKRAKVLSECAKDPKQQAQYFSNPQFAKCMRPLSIAAKTAYGTYQFSRRTEKEYLTSSRLDFPELLDLPKELDSPILGKLRSNNDEYKKALVSILQKFPGTRMLDHDGMYLTLIPGEDYDLWLNGLGTVGFLSIGVQKNDRSHRPLTTPKTFYNLHHFDARDNGEFRLTTVSTGGPFSCRKCHTVGGRFDFPAVDINGYKTLLPQGEAPKDSIAWMRTRILNTGFTEMDSIDLPVLPKFADDDPVYRTIEFVERCANSGTAKFPNDRLMVIKESMNCAACHGQGNVVPELIPMPNTDIIDQRIISGHMPPGADDPHGKNYLNPEERLALKRCLNWEYFGEKTPSSDGLFSKYLRQDTCPL